MPFVMLLVAAAPLGAQSLTAESADAALRKAVGFYREHVSVQGGYLWRYSEDLSLREGEGDATATLAWVQPPGTPSVGQAYLTAYERTGEPYLLEAAVETARALVKGQLASGGWDYRIEFDPQKRGTYAYRVDGAPGPRARNVTTLDDNTTQSALRFLMHVDRTLKFADGPIHSAVEYALNQLREAQYPNGAWPQRFSAPPKDEDYPVVKANYPATWSRTYPGTNYMDYYTLNDNAQADVIDTMFEAAEIYGNQQYFESARRGGDFLILAQMPEPQPAWAQQYNAQMQPAWARKFEPPSITGGESQGAIRILMQVYRQTGDKKYLEPIPRALDYLEKSQLPGNRIPRFLELKTNRPLYFTRQYELVYTDDDLPTHYGFITGLTTSRLRSDYERLVATPADQLKRERTPERFRPSDDLTAAAGRVVAELDSRGAWVEEGKLAHAGGGNRPAEKILDMRTFARNVDTLSRYLAAGKR
ncbi:MAG: pectate lyase [Pirellulaceae bacterium]